MLLVFLPYHVGFACLDRPSQLRLHEMMPHDREIRRVRCVGLAANDGGTFQGFVGTGMDVTEQEQINRGTTAERA